MKLNQFLKDQIVNRARQRLTDIESEASSQASKTDQQLGLDTIFARHSNNVDWNDFAEIVKLITGYRPNTVPAKRENFQILSRTDTQSGNVFTWIVLKGNVYGFGATEHSYYTLNSTDRLATSKEARAFIKKLEAVPEVELTNWCLRFLGADFFTAF